MAEDQVLNQVYRFKHKAPSDCQDESMCIRLAKWFAAFVVNLKAIEGPELNCCRVEPLADDRVVPASAFSTHEVQVLQQATQRLTALSGRHKRGDVRYDPWLPKYGCVLQRTHLNATTVKIEVLFVDGWEHTLHFLPSGECVHSAISPKRNRDSGDWESEDKRHHRAWINLEGCSFLIGTSCMLNELLEWRKLTGFPASYKDILMLRTFEAFMFEKALLLNGDGHCGQESGDNTFDLEQMQTFVTQYQQIVTSWRQLPRMTSVLDVEQRSREMLVMWTAFCLVHQRCVSEVPLCASYNIALKWTDLRVAVLSDQAAISALQHVAQYIRTWNNATHKPPLFHLTNQKATFDFGQKFGLTSSSMLAMYNQEIEIWEAQVREKWSEIEAKKRTAEELRAKIARQNMDLQSRRILLAEEEERLRREYGGNRYYDNNRMACYAASCAKRQMEADIQCFMHRYLSATSARLGVFEQPFHRQVDLNPRRLEFIRDALEELKLFGGIQMVAPEHRMSLELKRLELGNDSSLVKMTDEILDSDQFVDVLDECDALLHHKYHLVYAVGIPVSLGNGVERWMAAEALLRAVANKSSGSRVCTVLQAPHVSCMSPDYATRLGSYEGTRLNAVVESTELLRNQLKEALVLDLIDEASFELMWLNALGSGAARGLLVTAITDLTVSLEEALGEYMPKLAPYTAQLLALRGLVAFGVFEHCMEKRYRVDFGLPVPGTRQKKIAIPFRAADVPSERSEFSHPDVCIVLTLLGYYHGGLRSEEIRNAFQMLLRLDISEQNQRYDQWFASVESGLDDDERMALSDVRHVSLADARQFKVLCRVYKFCMETINFYLNTCVFPNDTQQYPQRLSRTAWNLTAGKSNIGFSGTNDNHRLLPLSVAQQEPNEPSLLGTNGKMIDKILQVTHRYEVIVPNLQRASIPWQSVLLYAINKKAQALIDTGALLAGVDNNGAAEFLLQQPDFDFAGVTYFDSHEELNCWMIVEKARRIKAPLKKASMLEKETFVIFDEARSRGSDMKLLPDAAAVLTLGPKLTKDKLMQGAGRMRQLGCNQTLWIASFDEVAQSLLQSSGRRELSCVSAVDVLNWVMDNTKAEAVRGLLEWAGNGIHFRKTQLHQDKELVDENWSLETLYQEKVAMDKIAQVIKSKAFSAFKDSTDELVDEICLRGFVYGLDDEVCVTSHTDECE